MSIPEGVNRQNDEFNALDKLIAAYKKHNEVAVVDDYYPQVRHEYEIAMREFISAIAINRPQDYLWARVPPEAPRDARTIAALTSPAPAPDVAGVVERLDWIIRRYGSGNPDTFYINQARVLLTTLSAENARMRADNPDVAYKLGMEDGYEKAVHDIDVMTGGDGEYCYCLGHESDRHCPDAEAMKARIVARFEAATTPTSPQHMETSMDAAQIKHMVDRFLGWKLPENFNPDGGISFQRLGYEDALCPMPVGTNLLDATQAEAMVRHMIDGLPSLALTAPSERSSDGVRPHD